MSDPLKGLGNFVSNYATQQRNQSASADSSVSQKSWGADGYSPSSSSYRAMGLVQQSVTARFSASIEGRTSSTAEQASTQESKNDFSPERVAQRILSHVGNYMEKLQQDGASDDRLSTVFASAKEAVQQGMDDAKEKLEALGWLANGGVQQGIDQTQSLLDEGFDSLESVLFDTNEQVTSALEASSSQSYRREDFSTMKVTTQEGDVVSINLYALNRSEASDSLSVSDDGMAYSRYQSTSQAFAFDFSVEGDLNDDELAAIQEMMQSAGEVSDLFFSGDVSGALQKGFDMGFDASQLANFSMTLQTTQTMKTSQAVSAYSQNNGMRSIQEPLTEYRQALEDTMLKASELFDDFRSVVESTMSDILAMREQQEQTMTDMKQIFDYQQEMIDRIAQWIQPQDANINGVTSDEVSKSE